MIAENACRFSKSSILKFFQWKMEKILDKISGELTTCQDSPGYFISGLLKVRNRNAGCKSTRVSSSSGS